MGILQMLGIEPSAQSLDYVNNKKQFHLHSLLTEQRHPGTWNLSFAIQADAEAGLRMLLSVDDDVTDRIARLAEDPRLLDQAASAIVRAIRNGRKVYVYGCGATGRLAKQMESSFWRPFWARLKKHDCWKRLASHLPGDIDARLIGEMTGADRALVSSLEGFEDLQLIGRLQMQEHGVERGDVVICVTEGGETSSVIGTILGALAQYGELAANGIEEARHNLYFVYNNPDEVLRPFQRSATVVNSPGITKINLTTGPQAITGSTRLQATTSETFVVGTILEEAIFRLLRESLDKETLRDIGLECTLELRARLLAFRGLKAAVDASVPELSAFSRLESETYRRGRFATYFAKQGLITVFIDNTERSPTFRLYPLDNVQDRERRCWTQVWTEAADSREAWRVFLGRPFRGLDSDHYRKPFEEQVDDLYLREAALRSLANAGSDQEYFYDFSFSPANIARRGPQQKDLGVVVVMGEEVRELLDPDSCWRRFLGLFRERGANVAMLVLAGEELQQEVREAAALLPADAVTVSVVLKSGCDPIGLRHHIALKMLLNAHSTGIMAILGRVIGNTMTNVSPSNLKLIGRATYLILSHVNDTLSQPEWIRANGSTRPVSFAEANAVLIDAVAWVRSREMGQTAEVALSIVRMLEAFRRKGPVEWTEAQQILDSDGLAAYLARHNPSLGVG